MLGIRVEDRNCQSLGPPVARRSLFRISAGPDTRQYSGSLGVVAGAQSRQSGRVKLSCPVRIRMCEEDAARRCHREWHTVPYSPNDRHFVPSGNPVEVNALPTLRNREVHDSASRYPEILHCRPRDIAEDRRAGNQLAQLEHLQAQLVAAYGAGEIAKLYKFCRKAVRAGFGDAGPAAEVCEPQGGDSLPERAQQEMRLGEYGVGLTAVRFSRSLHVSLRCTHLTSSLSTLVQRF